MGHVLKKHWNTRLYKVGLYGDGVRKVYVCIKVKEWKKEINNIYRSDWNSYKLESVITKRVIELSKSSGEEGLDCG